MPFTPQLKNALWRRGGELSSDYSLVSFKKGNDIITFIGTGKGKPNEEVEINLNGKKLNLSRWLDASTPILKTGNQTVKSIYGTDTDCMTICGRILNDLGFLSPGEHKMYGKRKIQPSIIKKQSQEKTITPDHLKELIDNIKKLQQDPEHKERAHESLVQDYYEILGYKRFEEIKYQRGRIDVCIKINNKLIIVNEVKRNWKLSHYHREVVIQGYNYANEVGARIIVITNGDYYAIFDRNKGLSYDEHFVGEFTLSNLTKDKIELTEFLNRENLKE